MKSQEFSKRKFRTKKALGQNFLVSDFHLRKLTESLEETLRAFPESVILEIACGTGALTNYLLRSFPETKIYALDLDGEALSLIPETKNLFKLEQDILKFNFSDLKHLIGGDKPVIVIGNLPFQIATKIFWKLVGETFESSWNLREAKVLVLMFQKEVAQRIAAKPAEKSYNQLSIAAQLKSQVKYLFEVPKECFEPRPKVEAAVLKIFPQFEQRFFDLSLEEKIFFRKIVKQAFLYPRKKIANALRPFLTESSFKKVASKFDLNLRPVLFSSEDLLEITRLSMSTCEH